MSEVTDGATPAPVEDAIVTLPNPGEQTAEPAAQVETPETEQSEATTDDDGADDTAQPETVKPAKGVQKRLDELTKARHEAQRDRDYWRELAMRQNAPEPTPARSVQEAPQESDFEDYTEFQRAMVRHEIRQEIEAERRQQETVAKTRTFEDRVSQARERFTDYDSVVFDPSLKITPVMADVIKDSDIGPEVAYHLGTNSSEAARIATLPPHRQAVELGKIEAALIAAHAEPKAQPSPKTPPPPPPKTVAGIAAGATKAPESMSMSEYVAWRKASQS